MTPPNQPPFSTETPQRSLPLTTTSDLSTALSILKNQNKIADKSLDILRLIQWDETDSSEVVTAFIGAINEIVTGQNLLATKTLLLLSPKESSLKWTVQCVNPMTHDESPGPYSSSDSPPSSAPAAEAQPAPSPPVTSEAPTTPPGQPNLYVCPDSRFTGAITIGGFCLDPFCTLCINEQHRRQLQAASVQVDRSGGCPRLQTTGTCVDTACLYCRPQRTEQ